MVMNEFKKQSRLIRKLAAITKERKLKWLYIKEGYYTTLLDTCVLSIKYNWWNKNVDLTIKNSNQEISFCSDETQPDGDLTYLYKIAKKLSIKELQVLHTQEKLIDNITKKIETL